MSEAGREGRGKGAAARGRRAEILVALGGTLLSVFFLSLGLWQVERLSWKLDLIERVDARIHAPATPLAPPAEWPAISRGADEYRHVELRGRFRHQEEALVQAVTELGPGFWVLTPLDLDGGGTVLVNRGFVPPERRASDSRQESQPGGAVSLSGLVRMSEPDGGFLRANDPAADRWFSRDVATIAAARGIADAAPFFVDAEATANPGGIPVGGLTVVSFRNSHLIYALTWFALALMVAGATLYVLRDERRRARARTGDAPAMEATR